MAGAPEEGIGARWLLRKFTVWRTKHIVSVSDFHALVSFGVCGRVLTALSQFTVRNAALLLNGSTEDESQTQLITTIPHFSQNQVSAPSLDFGKSL